MTNIIKSRIILVMGKHFSGKSDIAIWYVILDCQRRAVISFQRSFLREGMLGSSLFKKMRALGKHTHVVCDICTYFLARHFYSPTLFLLRKGAERKSSYMVSKAHMRSRLSFRI